MYVYTGHVYPVTYVYTGHVYPLTYVYTGHVSSGLTSEYQTLAALQPKHLHNAYLWMGGLGRVSNRNF